MQRMATETVAAVRQRWIYQKSFALRTTPREILCRLAFVELFLRVLAKKRVVSSYILRSSHSYPPARNLIVCSFYRDSDFA